MIKKSVFDDRINSLRYEQRINDNSKTALCDVLTFSIPINCSGK